MGLQMNNYKADEIIEIGDEEFTEISNQKSQQGVLALLVVKLTS